MRLACPSIILAFAVSLACGCGTATPMQRIRVAADHKGFVFSGSGERFLPWGQNYAAEGLDDTSERAWTKIENDLEDLKSIGTNVIRVHLQFPRFMDGPDKPNAAALAHLGRLLRAAQKRGIYLDITGLACYRKDQRAAWYDALGDDDRWATQARFWEAVSATCAKSPAVFCYDLMNEPIVSGTREGGWYTGEMGGYEFLQRLSLAPGKRSGDEIAGQWTRTLVEAIHKHDKTHLITIGLLPAWGLSPKAVGPYLDFIAVHIYPSAGKVKDAIANLRQFDIGKPIVIEETFPLSCGVADERKFLRESRGIASGWIGQYPAEPLAQLRSLKQSGHLTAGQAAYLSWIELFQSVGPAMIGMR